MNVNKRHTDWKCACGCGNINLYRNYDLQIDEFDYLTNKRYVLTQLVQKSQDLN